MYAPADHGESIYSLIPPKAAVPPKPPMYRSSIPSDLPPTSSTFHQQNTTYPAISNIGGDRKEKVTNNRDHADFGKAPGTYTNAPTSYMKRGAKTTTVPTLAEVKRTNPDQLKPSQIRESRFKDGGGPPKRGDVPVMNLVTSKNFVVANAVETILAAPKKVQDNTKDYLHKEDYGKVPKYLSQIKKDIDAEYDYIRQLQEQQASDSQPAVKPLDEDERQSLIDGLKTNWERVNTEYQATTHLTILDTTGKKRRKEKYEAELAQIEKDIERLNRSNIHVDLGR